VDLLATPVLVLPFLFSQLPHPRDETVDLPERALEPSGGRWDLMECEICTWPCSATCAQLVLDAVRPTSPSQPSVQSPLFERARFASCPTTPLCLQGLLRCLARSFSSACFNATSEVAGSTPSGQAVATQQEGTGGGGGLSTRLGVAPLDPCRWHLRGRSSRARLPSCNNSPHRFLQLRASGPRDGSEGGVRMRCPSLDAAAISQRKREAASL
jgi:hypothetical protein